MEASLEPIISLPGINSISIFSDTDGLKPHLENEHFDAIALKKTAAIMADQYNRTQNLFPETEAITSYFDTHCYYIRKIDRSRFIFIEHTTDLDYQLLNLKTKTFIELNNAAAESDLSTTDDVTRDKDLTNTEIRALMSSGDLSNRLTGMSWALSKTVGPIGPMLFHESMAQWLKSGTPNLKALPNLVQTVCKNIQDTEKEEKYNQKCAQFLIGI